MYKELKKETAREVGVLIQELSHARTTYMAYVYKIASDNDYLGESFVGIKKVEVDADLSLVESLKAFMESREDLISMKLNIPFEEIKSDNYCVSFGFGSLIEMIESIGEVDILTPSDKEMGDITRRIIGEKLDQVELNKKIEEIIIERKKALI